MARKPKALVLDSWTVIAFLEDEPSGQRVADLISNAHEEAIPVYMYVVNAGEVWYIIDREIPEKEADSSIKELRALRIQIENVDWELTQEAALFKAQHKMSFADCYAAALAKSKKADLVTGDKEFKPLEGEIKIEWM
ncbi:type II toxin-antitoxin system VapC family toxin [candidate division KSB1 bacterium]|nr:type II toxin-antitoxin system VapC family toxin [candidate division KSB1 bacterium]